MAYTPHSPVKPEKIVELTHGLIEPELTLARLVTREAFDKFAGAKDDTITYRVPGRLPYRRKNFRDDRSNPLIFDVYKEGKTTVTWGGYIYNGTKLTDEQAQFDLDGWSSLLTPQTNAVAAGINSAAADLITSAPYEVTIAGANTHLRSAIGEARKVLNRFRVPEAGRILIVGSDFEQCMLEDEKLTLAQYVGDVRADTALGQAIIGKIMGFTVVVDLTIDPEDAYAIVPSGYVQLLGAPMVPQSVPFGSSINKNGLALRWMRDYDTLYRTDRSLIDSWEGHNFVKDRFLPEYVLAEDDPHAPFDPDDLNEYFVRGVKLTIEGAPGDSIYPLVSDAAKADLIAETGIKSTDKWTPPTV